MIKNLRLVHPWMLPWTLCLISVLGLVEGCASSSSQPQEKAKAAADIQRERAQETRIEDLNEQLALQSRPSGSDSQDKSADSYRLGPDDLLDIVVLGVPELNRQVRIDSKGSITLPLVGGVSVGGLTVSEASRVVAERYEESYLKDPQVSVLIEEYRSQRITVLGAVNEPEVYAVQRQMTLLGSLAMAGGVTEKASNTVYVTDWVTDPDTQERKRRSLVVSLDELVSKQGQDSDLILGEEAVINVPSAGVAYVEGAVKAPGAYDLRGNTTVLKALAMAGGLLYEAEESGLNLLRQQDDGTYKPRQFDLDSLRENPTNDIELEDGDIVVVESNAFKAGVWRLIDTARGFFGFGFAL